MNARQREYIDSEVDRLLDENGGDGWLALRASIVERISLGSTISNGYVRLAALDQRRLPPKPQAPSIDDPLPEEATPS